MFLTHVLLDVSDHPFEVWCTLAILLLEHSLECTETATTFAVLTSHRVVNDCSDCTLSFFNSTFKISLKSKTDSTVSLTLNYSKIIHATCLAVRKRLSLLCSFFFNEDFSVEVSVDDLLETTCYFRIKNLEVCLQLDPDD